MQIPSPARWANLDPRPDPNPTVQSADAGTLVRQVRAATGEYAWVVIDCPPGISRVNAEAIRASDIVLIPCKVRVWYVWACEDIVDAVKLRQAGNRGWPRAAFVISMERPRTRLSRSIGVGPSGRADPPAWDQEGRTITPGRGPKWAILAGATRQEQPTDNTFARLTVKREGNNIEPSEWSGARI